ncbi:class I SAM-dependent methyltransferase [Uliginosibacterium sp. sgz301328]|uniref:class I SAM-dependent DNA methyltransferase n=1 Tax=Uliginosibacterium sp. sgz301328 TaxID=3243764 RepID=UPI00359CEF88
MTEESNGALNRESYDRIAPSWDAARSEFFGREREYLDMLLEGLPGNARVLDLGCGTGRPMGAYVLERGLSLTGVDQSAALLALARERYSKGEWIESRIEDFMSDECYDAIICWDALFHIERERHPAIFARMVDMLDAGGRMMVTVGGSEHPAFRDTMFGQTFFYDSHSPDAVVAMLEALGMELVVREFMNLPDGGRDKGRYAVVARRRF